MITDAAKGHTCQILFGNGVIDGSELPGMGAGI